MNIFHIIVICNKHLLQIVFFMNCFFLINFITTNCFFFENISHFLEYYTEFYSVLGFNSPLIYQSSTNKTIDEFLHPLSCTFTENVIFILKSIDNTINDVILNNRRFCSK